MRRRAIFRTWSWRLLVLAISVVIVHAIRLPYLASNLTPGKEGQLGIRYWEIARTSFARGDGFPLWDRSMCAGLPFLGNPDTPLLSSWVAGVFHVRGDTMLRWYTTLATLVGILGAYAWCRGALGLLRLPALYAGGAFAAAGYLVFNLLSRSHMIPYMFLPWMLLLGRLGERDLRAAMGCGAVLALTAIEGGIYPTGLGLVALVLFEAPRILIGGPTRVLGAGGGGTSATQVLAMLGVALLVFFTLGGVKIFPVLVQVLRYPVPGREADHFEWKQFVPMFIDRGPPAIEGALYGPYEYRAYLGPIAAGAGVAGAGAAVVLRPRRWGLFSLLVGALLLARGVYSPTAPYVLLSRLPVFSVLRVPSHFLSLVCLAMAACGAVAFDAALRIGATRIQRLIVCLLGAAALYDPVAATARMYREAPAPNAPPLPRPAPIAGPYHLVDGNDFGRHAEYPARNVGVVQCYRLFEYPEGSGYALWPASPGATVKEGGSLRALSIRQNEYLFDAHMPKAGTVHFEQTFDRDWRPNVGDVLRSPLGALELRLPAGDHTVDLRYRPAGLLLGIAATALGVLGSVGTLAFLAVRARRRRDKAVQPAGALRRRGDGA